MNLHILFAYLGSVVFRAQLEHSYASSVSLAIVVTEDYFVNVVTPLGCMRCSWAYTPWD